MEFTGERYVSGLDGPIKHEHYHRYLFATRFCGGKDVLDVASGEGYGSSVLSQVARSVVGVDIDEPTVTYANQTYLSNNLSFRRGHAADLPIGTASIDVVVSFETIEHLDQQAEFLAEAARVLRQGGLIIISSPNKPVYDQRNNESNPFHLHELDQNEFLGLLTREFPNVILCGQSAVDGSVIVCRDGPGSNRYESFEAEDGLLYMRRAGLAHDHFFIALASAAPLPAPQNSILHNAAHFAGLRAALEMLARDAETMRAEAASIEGQKNEEIRRVQEELGRTSEGAAAIALDRDRLADALEKAHSREAELTRGMTASQDLVQSLRRELDQRQSKADALLRDWEQRYRRVCADRDSTARALDTRFSELADQLSRRTEEVRVATDQLSERTEELRAAKEYLARVFTSTSWRVSAPIRWAGGLRRRRPGWLLVRIGKLAYWTCTFQLRRRLRERRLVRLLYSTGSFDHDYYLKRYPDVVKSGLDPALHYLRLGSAEERDPSSAFVTAVYRSRHPELSLGINPLVDAILSGRTEDGRPEIPAFAPLPSPLVGASISLPSTATAEPTTTAEGLRTLTFHPQDNPDLTVVVDARIITDAVERTLRAIAASQHAAALELIILVSVGAEVALAGARRVAAGTEASLVCFDRLISETRAPYVAMVDGATEIEEETLSVGLATIAAPDVGVVCAARVGTDETLVDAGLLLDPDGSMRRRGAGLSPDHYAVASTEDVDVFPPGLFIASKEAWLAAGGLDSSYLDPSYAAADVSLRLHGLGHRVVCQPFMRGRIRAASAELTESPADCEHLLHERAETIEQMKHRRKPRVLFVDHFTPTPDQDAGSELIYWNMRIFLDIGYRVSFIPVMTLDSGGPYTNDLRRLGIECVSRPAVSTPEQYIRDNAAIFQLILLYRGPLAYQYIDRIRRVAPYTRVVFNTVDLHFLRAEREAALLRSAAKLRDAQNMKCIELASIRKADCTIILNRAELDVLSDVVGCAWLKFIPLVSLIPGCEAPFETRQDIVFIGGFAHPPNVDAMQYFVQSIWPLVLDRQREARLIIVGSNVTEEVQRLADTASRIEVRGFVADLGALFRSCRLTVAPLRYGAGMKGKVVSSLAHGVPCVATPIAVEGMGLVPDKDVLVANTPDGFAETVVALYNDADLWGQLSASGVAFAQANFSVARVTELLREMLVALKLPA